MGKKWDNILDHEHRLIEKVLGVLKVEEDGRIEGPEDRLAEFHAFLNSLR